MSRRLTHYDGRYDPRTPTDTASIVGTLALAALFPVALWAVSYPVTAAAVLAVATATLLLARVGTAAAARRLRGRTTAFELPGLDTRVEVRLAPKLNR